MFYKNKKTNMELEIIEQINIIPQILANYIDLQTGEIKLELPQNIRKIVYVASGSSYHCARFGVDLIEKYTKIQARAIYSSEFLLKNLIPADDGTLYVFITQSGETNDTVKSLKRVKDETSLPTLAVTNVENSTIWNLSDYRISCIAGVEKGIAATKSFTAQMICLTLILIKLSEDKSLKDTFVSSLYKLPKIIERVFEKRKEIKIVAKHLAKAKNVVITADGIAYSIAKEGALKIKETSYKNLYASILGEFMHGHVAVLNNKSTLIYVSVDKISERSIINLNEIKKDYQPILVFIGPSNEKVEAKYHLEIECETILQRLFCNVVILQIIALETALCLKRNVDNPKGLHKVVKN